MDGQQDPYQHTYLPPAPPPVPPVDPAQGTGASGGRPPRGRRLVATIGATALVAGLGGVGAGYALGHGAGASGSSDTTSSGRSNVSTEGGGGTIPIPGNGGWSWSGGQGSFSVPSPPDGGTSPDPFQSPGQGSTSTQGSTKATASQLVGLVRIVNTMSYTGGKAVGTGMVLTSDGEVVTNHHVVAGATSLKVKVMSTGKTYTATVVGTDTKDDVAVLQLAGASGLSTVKADTNGTSVGDAVTAVGDADGASYLSAAKGSIQAQGRSITTQSEASVKGQRLTGLLQISSDVISGDSGGATYDAQGQVVGMTTAASSGSNDVTGYAVPIAKVLRVAGDLESGVSNARYDYGYPAFLGVGLGRSGTTVQGVYAGTPASSAGIARGDKITAVDGTPVSTSSALRKAVSGHSPGDSISVSWTDASGASHTATVTLAKGPVA